MKKEVCLTQNLEPNTVIDEFRLKTMVSILLPIDQSTEDFIRSISMAMGINPDDKDAVELLLKKVDEVFPNALSKN